MGSSNPPNSFRDPFWSGLATKAEAKLGLPAGLLVSILQNGERSNADQVSEANAKTPFQVIPSTRRQVLEKYGIDAYLSPENAAEAAGLVLKEGLDRNKGDPILAAGEYHAGPDRKNWGPRTQSYMDRVSAGFNDAKATALDNGFAQWMAANPAAPAPTAAPTATGDPLADGFGAWMRQTGGKARTGAAAVPTAQEQATGVYTPRAASPAAPEPGLVDQALGTGEAALNAVTGATGGTLGLIGGTIGGLAGAVVSGQYGTSQGAQRVEDAAMQGAQALTYQPRTPAGQAQAEAVGRGVQQLIPVMPLTGELGALSRGVGPVITAGSDAARGAVDRVLPGGAAAAPAAPAVAAAVPAAPAVAPAVAPAAAAAAPRAMEVAQTAKQAADGSGKATRILADQAAPNPETVASANRLGIGDYLQPDHVTTNEAYRQVVGTIKSNPQSAVALAEREGLARVAERASNLIDEIGGTNDLSALSADVKTRMLKTHEELSAREDGLYGSIRKQMPAQTDAPAPNVLAFIAKRADDLGGAENLTPLEKTIAAKLTPTGDDLSYLGPAARAKLAEQGISGQKQPTYALLDDVRKDIGSATKGRGAFKDSDSGLAKALYAQISKDQEAAVAKAGLQDTFEAARKATAVRKGLEDDLSSLFGKNLDRSFVAGGDLGLAGATRTLAGGDASRLVRLLQAVPADLRQNVVASGISTVFRNAATRGEMNFTGYSKWFEGLMRQRQAYAAVMSELPLSARKQLTALYRVSKGISDSLATRTKTGALNTIKAEMMGTDTMMQNLFSLAKRTGIRAVASEVATSAVGMHGVGLASALSSALTKGKPKTLAAVDALLASPEFAQLTKTQAATPARASAVRTLAASPAFSKVLRKSGKQMTLTERERWIVQSLQGVQDPEQRRRPSAERPALLH